MAVQCYLLLSNRYQSSFSQMVWLRANTIADLALFFQNGDFTKLIHCQFCGDTNNQVSKYVEYANSYFKAYNNNNCQNTLVGSYNTQPCILFPATGSISQSEWDILFKNKRLKVDICLAGINHVPYYIHYDVLCLDKPTNNYPAWGSDNKSTYWCSTVENLDGFCDNLEQNASQYFQSNGLTFKNISLAEEVEPEPCVDVRNSADIQSLHLVVSDGQNNVTTTDITFKLSDGANQELALRTYMNDSVYNYFNNIYNQNQGVMARIMFNGGVCRSACTVRIVAKVYGQAVSVEPSLMPPYVTLDNDILAGHDVDILRATFEECNDKPVRIEEDLVAYLDGLKSQNFFSVGFSIYQVVPYKIVITGCEALTEWCCDDVTPIENDSIEYEGYDKPLIEGYGSGSGGGGSDVDISCICNGLTSLNQMLATKLDNLVDGQAVIADAISEMQVEVDNTCVCDNLESISDNLEAIKESIDDKNLSVVNNNTVQPPVNNVSVQPPVNNVSVQPPVNNISLPTTQLENIATNTRALNCVCASLENLEVIQQGTKESIDGVKSNLQCGNDGIACVLQSKNMSVDVDLNSSDITNGLEAITEKLDDINNNVHDGLINSDDESNLENISESLNTSDDEPKSLADVLKDKEMGTNIDVEVSPADDVNINRVYYTNQRNGETNI